MRHIVVYDFEMRSYPIILCTINIRIQYSRIVNRNLCNLQIIRVLAIRQCPDTLFRGIPEALSRGTQGTQLKSVV